MALATFSVRMDESLKRQFDALCSDFGMNATTAFKDVYKRQARNRLLPIFPVTQIILQLTYSLKKMLTTTLSPPYAACFLRAAAFPINVCPTRKHRVLFISAQSLSMDF